MNTIKPTSPKTNESNDPTSPPPTHTHALQLHPEVRIAPFNKRPCHQTPHETHVRHVTTWICLCTGSGPGKNTETQTPMKQRIFSLAPKAIIHSHQRSHSSSRTIALYAVRAVNRVPAGSCHFSCSTDTSQSVVSFPCIWKREHIKTMCASIAWDLALWPWPRCSWPTSRRLQQSTQKVLVAGP